MEITSEKIDEIAARRYTEGLKLFYTTPDYDYVEKKFRAYIKEHFNIEMQKCHIVNGMRELRAIHPIYSIFDGGFSLRIKQDGKVDAQFCREEGKEQDASIKSELDEMDGLDQCFIGMFDNGDFALLAPPVQHHVINDYPGSTEMMLHNENGPAILYADGSKAYFLWDVCVDEKWVETPADKISAQEVQAIENVDERAAVMRRIGLHLVVDEATVIDQLTREQHPHGPYELLDLSHLFEGRKALHLKMTCPSTGMVHVEGVDNGCEYVQEALNWRANRYDWRPYVLDGVVNPNGNPNQRQQGDLHLERLDQLPAGGVLQQDRKLQDDKTVIRHTISEGQVYRYDGYQCIVTEREVPTEHPQHNDVVIFDNFTGAWNGREVDHLRNIVRDLID